MLLKNFVNMDVIYSDIGNTYLFITYYNHGNLSLKTHFTEVVYSIFMKSPDSRKRTQIIKENLKCLYGSTQQKNYAS